MKKAAYIRSLMLVLGFVFCMTACGTWNIESKVKDLELGMTKKEVVNTLGNNYKSLGAISTPNGNLETIYYEPHPVYGGDYTVRFLDGRLVEWFAGAPANPPAMIMPPPMYNAD